MFQKLTPMVVGEIQEANQFIEIMEHDGYYQIRTSRISLDIYKQDFRIGKVFNSEGELIAESGSKTKNEFANALDFLSYGISSSMMGNPVRIMELRIFLSSQVKQFTGWASASILLTKWGRPLASGHSKAMAILRAAHTNQYLSL